MTFDLIIVSKSTTPGLRSITQNCIDSALKDGADLNIIIVETGGREIAYKGINETVIYNDVFNYNRALNKGLERSKADIVILANNDIFFHEGWSAIGRMMIENDFPSACALSKDPRQRIFERGDYIYPGYDIGTHIAGWCIFATRECVDKIGRLDEKYDFWYSDNAYAEQLIDNGIRHGLFCNIRVDHITSATLRTIPVMQQRHNTIGARRRYAV